MSATVWLDTNALPRRGPLGSVLVSAVIRVARQHGADVCLTETVYHESVNSRREAAEEAVQSLTEALNKADRAQLGIEPLYLPDPQDIAAAWGDDLRSSFEVVPTHGEDAREALRREALRETPARNGLGARDASIWLTIKRRHLADAEQLTYFVSDNISDFGSNTGETLHPDLLSELEAASDRFFYHRNLPVLLEELAERIEVELTSEDLSEVKAPVLDALLAWGIAEKLAKARGLADAPSPGDIEIELSAPRTLRAFSVEGVTLALVALSINVAASSSENGDMSSDRLAGRIWLAFQEELGSDTSVDIDVIGEPGG